MGLGGPSSERHPAAGEGGGGRSLHAEFHWKRSSVQKVWQDHPVESAWETFCGVGLFPNGS